MTTFNFPTFAKQNNNILEYSQNTSLTTFSKSKKYAMIDNIIFSQINKINANILNEQKHQHQKNTRREKVLNR